MYKCRPSVRHRNCRVRRILPSVPEQTPKYYDFHDSENYLSYSDLPYFFHNGKFYKRVNLPSLIFNSCFKIWRYNDSWLKMSIIFEYTRPLFSIEYTMSLFKSRDIRLKTYFSIYLSLSVILLYWCYRFPWSIRDLPLRITIVNENVPLK